MDMWQFAVVILVINFRVRRSQHILELVEAPEIISFSPFILQMHKLN